ncbi:MAG: hypothetical protein ABIH89_03425 [Elusimicrobiota bacterium]
MKLRNIFLIAVILPLLSGCGTPKEDPNLDTDEEVIKVIKDNMNAYRNEDIKGILATMDKESPSYIDIPPALEPAFQNYDLEYRMEYIKVISKSETMAKVLFVQATRKINGPPFRNNRITGYHLLKKKTGEWKIARTDISAVKYLK